MLLSTRVASYLFLFLAVVPACSSRTDPIEPGADGGATSDAGATPDVDPSALCAEYARLDCDDTQRCNSMYVDWTFGSYAACLSRTEEQCKVWSKLPGAKVNTPELIACIRAWSTRSCDDASPPPSECSYPPGTLATGAGCQQNRECATGYCRRPDPTACGSCTERLPDGAACLRRAECQSGSCQRQVCVPTPKVGDSCVGGFCTAYLACIEGVCKTIKWVEPGGRCDASDLICNWGSCIDGVCLADKLGEVGQSCEVTEKGPYVYCRDGECNATTNKCENRPAIGSPCSDASTCAGTAICASGQCKALSADVCTMPANAVRESFRDESDPSIGRPAARVRDGRLLGFRD